MGYISATDVCSAEKDGDPRIWGNCGPAHAAAGAQCTAIGFRPGTLSPILRVPPSYLAPPGMHTTVAKCNPLTGTLQLLRPGWFRREHLSTEPWRSGRNMIGFRAETVGNVVGIRFIGIRPDSDLVPIGPSGSCQQLYPRRRNTPQRKQTCPSMGYTPQLMCASLEARDRTGVHTGLEIKSPDRTQLVHIVGRDANARRLYRRRR